MINHNLLPLSFEIHTYTALLLKFFNQASEERLQSQGVKLSSLQLGIMRMLQYEVLTISIISQRLGLDPSSIMRMVDSLEKKGLLYRGVDPNDRRRNPLHITDQGKELVTAVPVITEKDLTFQALQSLGEDQVKQLRDLLFQIMQHFPDGRLVSGMLSGPPDMGFDPSSTEHDI